MFRAIKEFFFGKPQPTQPEAPYKVEAPVFKPTADAAPVESVVATPVKKSAPPRAKKPAVAKPAAKKPAAPRKPKTPTA
jgi:NADH:ubiquinone reductase (H+-translocating)